MRRSTLLERLPVRPSDFVVEIGAGPRPYRYTKLILDKYPFDNVERHGDIVNVAPVIKADALKIPLADKACDLLFVSHVLEHLEDPGKFIEEARRCARRIYLEFPTFRRELMYAWSFHRWVIGMESGRLIFYRNDMPQLFGDFFHSHYDFLLDMWSEERFEELNTFLFGEGDEVGVAVGEDGVNGVEAITAAEVEVVGEDAEVHRASGQIKQSNSCRHSKSTLTQRDLKP